MKALSIKQPWASMIESGLKTIETRKWKTDYRGDLLICSSLKPEHYQGQGRPIDELTTREKQRHFGMLNEPLGVALCIVKLVDCVPMTSIHEAGAKCAVYPKAWAWILEDVRKIEPFPVKGKLGLFEVEYK